MLCEQETLVESCLCGAGTKLIWYINVTWVTHQAGCVACNGVTIVYRYHPCLILEVDYFCHMILAELMGK